MADTDVVIPEKGRVSTFTTLFHKLKIECQKIHEIYIKQINLG